MLLCENTELFWIQLFYILMTSKQNNRRKIHFSDVSLQERKPVHVYRIKLKSSSVSHVFPLSALISSQFVQNQPSAPPLCLCCSSLVPRKLDCELELVPLGSSRPQSFCSTTAGFYICVFISVTYFVCFWKRWLPDRCSSKAKSLENTGWLYSKRNPVSPSGFFQSRIVIFIQSHKSSANAPPEAQIQHLCCQIKQGSLFSRIPCRRWS